MARSWKYSERSAAWPVTSAPSRKRTLEPLAYYPLSHRRSVGAIDSPFEKPTLQAISQVDTILVIKGGSVLRRADALKTLLMVFAVACLTLALMPHSAHAGQSGSNMHRSGPSHALNLGMGRAGVLKLHRASKFRGLSRAQRFGHHFGGKRKHARFKRHRHHKGRRHLRFGRHHRLRHGYVYWGRYYDRYERDNDYRYKRRRRADYAPTSNVSPSQSPDYRPPTFKWIHVGAEGAPSEQGEALTNCLSVRTQITVDGVPMDAFGKVCMRADGIWRLIPTEQAR